MLSQTVTPYTQPRGCVDKTTTFFVGTLKHRADDYPYDASHCYLYNICIYMSNIGRQSAPTIQEFPEIVIRQTI